MSFELFTPAYQMSLIAQLISDPDAWEICRHEFKPEYFDSDLVAAVKYIANYGGEHGIMPSVEQIAVNSHGTNVPKFSEPLTHTDATIADFEQFVQYRAMSNVLLDGIEIIEKDGLQAYTDRVMAAKAVGVRNNDDAFAGLWIDECAGVEPPEFLIRDLLVKDTVTCVYGAPGSYKSFICLEAGYCLAAGIPFAGRAVPQTNVVYVAAEGQRGIALRLEALAEAHGKRPARNALRLITQPINLLDDGDVTKFIRYLIGLEKRENIDFGLVVLDTYSQCIAGADENAQAVASKATANMIRIRRDMNTTVVYVHHTGKDASRGMRGSDALRANTDGAVEIIRDGDTQAATMHVRRSKDAPTGTRQRFEMRFQHIARLADTDVEFPGSLVPDFIAEQAISKMAAPNVGRTLSWLEDLLRHMTEGQLISVGQAVVMTGRADNAHYKTKLIQQLPLDAEIMVRNQDDVCIGSLARICGSRANSQYGAIKCLSKLASD